MDPTAPQDNNNNQGTNPSSPPSPIQPGQFVEVSQTQPQTKPQIVDKNSPPPPSQAQSFAAAPHPHLASLAESRPDSPAPSPLASEGGPPSPFAPPDRGESLGEPPPQSEIPGPSDPNAPQTPQEPPQFPESQPNPTPYVAPTSQVLEESSPQSPKSTIQKMRLIIIIVGVILLVGIIVATFGFFILGKETNQPLKTEEQVQEQELPPPPPRTSGGFADLPPATAEASPSALEATASGQ